MPSVLKPPSNLAESFEGMRSDYAAAKASRYRRKRKGLASMGSGADYHYASQSDFLKMLEEARDMDRNDVIVGQTVDRAVSNTLQDGVTLDPKTGDKGADTALWNRWKAWTEDPEACDITGENTFAEMEYLVLRHTHVDGDHIALPTEEGQLQLVEAHRPRTPSNTKKNVIHGVQIDQNRRRVAYWLTKDDIDPSRSVSRVGDVVQYAAHDASGFRQVFHVYNPKRVSQTRGITAFAPIFDTCGMFEDIDFARLVQQQIVSCYAVFRMRELGFQASGSTAYGPVETQSLPGGGTRRIEGVSPGMEITGEPGEKLVGFSPDVPNPQFFEHVKLILTLVGINLGLPLVLVLLDASETNFSGFRGTVDQARLGFRRNQRWLVSRFHRPTYLWKVRQWLQEDPALFKASKMSGVDIFGHCWNYPKWPYIEPLKDASADLMRQRNALSSPRRIQAERGAGDWETLAEEIVDDNAYAILAAKKKAAEINKQFPEDPVHWRELISLPTPDGVTVSLSEPVDPAQPKPAGAGNNDKPRNPNRNGNSDA